MSALPNFKTDLLFTNTIFLGKSLVETKRKLPIGEAKCVCDNDLSELPELVLVFCAKLNVIWTRSLETQHVILGVHTQSVHAITELPESQPT